MDEGKAATVVWQSTALSGYDITLITKETKGN